MYSLPTLIEHFTLKSLNIWLTCMYLYVCICMYVCSCMYIILRMQFYDIDKKLYKYIRFYDSKMIP